MVRHFPHEVDDLEFVVSLLQAQDEKNTETWETRYVLLLWLSIIVIIPFNMSRYFLIDMLKELCDTPCKDGDARFITMPLKPSSDQLCPFSRFRIVDF